MNRMHVLVPRAPETADELAVRLAGCHGLAVFEATIRERRTAYFPQCLTEDELASLLDPAGLGRLLHSSPSVIDSTDVFIGSHLVRLKDMLHRSARDAVDVLGEQLSLGATVRFRNLEHQVESLRELGRSVAAVYGGATTINAYITPGGQKGFPPHFDNTDVFVLQISGAKQWTLFDSYTGQQELPLRDVLWDPERYRPNDPGQSFTLRAGDVVYIPRGGLHAAECLEDISFHLTISLDPTTAYDILKEELERWACEAPEARRRLAIDPAVATRDLQGLAADFLHWMGRQQREPRKQGAPAEPADAGERFNDVIGQLRSPGTGA